MISKAMMLMFFTPCFSRLTSLCMQPPVLFTLPVVACPRRLKTSKRCKYDKYDDPHTTAVAYSVYIGRWKAYLTWANTAKCPVHHLACQKPKIRKPLDSEESSSMVQKEEKVWMWRYLRWGYSLFVSQNCTRQSPKHYETLAIYQWKCWSVILDVMNGALRSKMTVQHIKLRSSKQDLGSWSHSVMTTLSKQPPNSLVATSAGPTVLCITVISKRRDITQVCVPFLSLLHFQKFHVKYQCCVWWNNTRMSSWTICVVRCTNQFCPLTSAHLSNTFLPSLYHFSISQLKSERIFPISRRVKHLPCSSKNTCVVNNYHLPFFGECGTISLSDRFLRHPHLVRTADAEERLQAQHCRHRLSLFLAHSRRDLRSGLQFRFPRQASKHTIYGWKTNV